MASAGRLAGVLPLLLPACTPPPDPPRLVLLYAPCTVSREFLSPYDDGVDFTPHLDRLAAEAVVFRRHMTEAGQSGVAYASLFSGAQATEHGVFAHPTPIAESVELIAERFARDGWETWFWGGHALASSEYDYSQGVPAEHTFERGLVHDDEAFSALLDRLRDDPSERALVITNFTVTHAPYQRSALEAFGKRFPERLAAVTPLGARLGEYLDVYRRNHIQLANNFAETAERTGLGPEEVAELDLVLGVLYAANVHRLDRMFGEVVGEIERRGLLDQSVIAFTTDHGEITRFDGALFPWTHGWELATEVLEIPWLIRAPPSHAVRGDYTGVSRSTDVLPTLAGLAGLPADSPRPEPDGGSPGAPPGLRGIGLGFTRRQVLRGIDLSGALPGRGPAPDLSAWSHTVVQHDRHRVKNATRWLEFHGGVRVAEPWVSLRRGDLFAKYRRLKGGTLGVPALRPLRGSAPTPRSLRARQPGPHSTGRSAGRLP